MTFIEKKTSSSSMQNCYISSEYIEKKKLSAKSKSHGAINKVTWCNQHAKKGNYTIETDL